MAKYLSLHQFTRNRATIQGDERFFPSGAFGMNGMGAQLFARARLACDKHTRLRGGGRNDGSIHRLHRAGIADKFVKTIGDRACHGLHELCQFMMLNRILHGDQKPLAVKGFHQKIIGPQPHC